MKKTTRPALVQPCTALEDHGKHPWRFSEAWPEGVFWHCPGRDNAALEEGARRTARAIKKARKGR